MPTFTEDNCLKLAVVLFAPFARLFSIAVPVSDQVYGRVHTESGIHEIL